MSNLPPPPSRGKPPNRRVLIIGGVAAAGIVYWAYKKNKASAPTTSTDPNIDPATGLPYSSSSYGSGGGAVGTTPSLYGFTDPYGNLISNPGSTIVTHPTTNGAWVQLAAGYLIAHGYDPLTTLTALGKYIAGGALTDDQMGIVQAAKAAEGEPPEPVQPAHVGPPVGQTTEVADGYYRDVATFQIWQVQNGTRYHVTAATWQKINTPPPGQPPTGLHPTWTSVLPSWAGYKLPSGGDI